jgi:hypothetical protein
LVWATACAALVYGCGDEAPTADAGRPDGAASDAASDGPVDREPPDGSADGSVDDAGLPPLPDCHRDRTSGSPPACGTGSYDSAHLIAGPGEPSFDAELARLAGRFDRQFHLLNASVMGVNTEVGVSLDRPEVRGQLEAFLATDSWDLEEELGQTATQVIDRWGKVAGAYAGVGIAADAYRYGTLRDQGAACDEVERARQLLHRSIGGLRRAVAITGTEGVIARGYARRDLPGVGQQYDPVPLFDESGAPLPPEKDNGTWRADNSADGAYSEYIWEDSCSRDQYLGWVAAFAAVWEVVRDDPTFDEAVKQQLQRDAAALARSLMETRESGRDLEIRDADGRRTFHGILHTEGVDTSYVPGLGNGFYAALSLGIMAGLAFVAEEPDIDRYVYRELVARRDLPAVAAEAAGVFIDMGVASNYSNYNMAFMGGWLATRYLCDDAARRAMAEVVATGLYDRPGRDRQPAEQAQTFYDLVYVLAGSGATAWDAASSPLRSAALERGLGTLRAFPEPPFWGEELINCDEREVEEGVCVAADGTELDLLGYVGRGDKLVSVQPVPMRTRPPSNYFWRTNPYEVNGGGSGRNLYGSPDLRFPYWAGRFTRASR